MKMQVCEKLNATNALVFVHDAHSRVSTSLAGVLLSVAVIAASKRGVRQ
jgi:hypothetical protein